MLNFDSIERLVEAANKENKNISDIVLGCQAEELGKSQEFIVEKMKEQLQTMKQSVNQGINTSLKSLSGLSGGDAAKMMTAAQSGNTILGKPFAMVIARALAASEVNACMGKIVAAPTAGSCGIIPAALISVQEEKGLCDDSVAMALLTSAGVGLVIAKRACISGAEGGCQAECGSAAAMAAAALAELLGGTPKMASHACAIAFKNVLGLTCDPVAGLVEVPCIKRNAIGAINAIAAAQMSLAGIESVIPPDEVIDAMMDIGRTMPSSLKETARGGLAATPTGQKIAKEFKSEI